jgi:branched-chain amino acid aminotransferase
MHEFVSFNGEIIRAIDARIPAISSAALYGCGIFTTIAIADREPFLWERHWARLETDAAAVGLDMADFGKERVTAALYELLARNFVIEGRARITFFDERPGPHWPYDTRRGTGMLIIAGHPRDVPERFRLTLSPYRINSASPLAGVKSCNYLENMLALDEAKARGFDEAVRLNERDEIAGACAANIFWEKDGRLFTPGLNSGCLPGTTRAHVIEKFGAEEVDTGIGVLETADAIFLTSAGLGMVQAAEFEGREFKAGDKSFGIDYR